MELLNYEILNASAPADKNAIPMFSCDTYPCFIDLAFSKNMSIYDVITVFPDDVQVEYEIMSSLDGVNFYKLGKGGKIARYIRIFIKYYSGTLPTINNIEVIGEDCSFPQKKTSFKEPPVWNDTEYSKAVTDEDIIAEVQGIIGRAIGEKYVESFELRLDRRLKEDYFTVESLRGKIRLISNSGVGLASAFNCYLKEVCSCHISRFGKQVKLPQNLPQVNGKIDRRTTYKYRYAYNYCTHSYSMAFWGEEEWQKEIDFLAMNGVNLVMDLTGMAEVYRRFLSKLGYRLREIKNFLSGPAYFAWNFMGNLYSVGGPVHDDYFAEKCELARKNHRRMQVLGMGVILQAYTGLVPNDIQKKNRDVTVLPQGKWNGLERPPVLSPDSVMFVKYAALFYESQREAFGDISHFYAGDICHEGGTMGKANAKEAYVNIMQSMLSFDKNAVWVLQSWGDNPQRLFTKAMKPYRDEHILMLDLYAEKDSRAEGKFAPLAKYNYLFGMLNNFGGRNGVYGNLDTLPNKLKSASLQPNFKGIALTAESTAVNPAVLELFFDCVWKDIADVGAWLKAYAVRRYGKDNKNIAKSVELLLQTAFCDKYYGIGPVAPECALCCRPESGVEKVSCRGSTKSGYPKAHFDEAVKLFLTDYDKFKDNECYVYDAVDLLRQALADRITDTVKKMASSYKSKDYFAFTEYSEKLLSLTDMLDRVLLNCKEFTLGNYLDKVHEYADKLDDFTKELYMINAKALITTWYSRRAADGKDYLHDYAHRQWGDLVGSFYKMRWEKFIEKVKTEMDGGKPADIDWFKVEWDWVLADTDYTKRVREDSLKALGKQILDK